MPGQARDHVSPRSVLISKVIARVSIRIEPLFMTWLDWESLMARSASLPAGISDRAFTVRRGRLYDPGALLRLCLYGYPESGALVATAGARDEGEYRNVAAEKTGSRLQDDH